MPYRPNQKCVKCSYCGYKAYSYVIMKYKDFKFSGHPSCKTKWMNNAERMREAQALGLESAKVKGAFIEVDKDLPFTPEEVSVEGLQEVIHESLAPAPAPVPEWAQIADLEGTINSLRDVNKNLRERNEMLEKIINKLVAS